MSAMLDIDAVTSMLKVSARHWRRMVDAGAAPQPCRLGRRTVWPEQVIADWVKAGCPKVRSNRGGAR
jgi:predicted DNA-binding transcriptional regulator AlpA